jgi:hypothetical protein
MLFCINRIKKIVHIRNDQKPSSLNFNGLLLKIVMKKTTALNKIISRLQARIENPDIFRFKKLSKEDVIKMNKRQRSRNRRIFLDQKYVVLGLSDIKTL